MRKGKSVTISLAICLLITVFLAVSLCACNITTDSPQTPQAQKATSFVCIDVNPSIELVLDQNNVVMSATGANKDGKVLLFEENGIVDAELDVAVSNIASLALKYGFVEDGSNVNVEVSSSTEQNGIFERIGDKFSAALKKADPQINVSFSTACDYVLQSELEKLKADNPDTKIQNLDVSTYRAVKKAMQNGVSLEEATDMSFDALLEKITDAQSDLESQLDESYQYAVNRAQYVFDNAKRTAENSVYVKYYSQKLVSTFTTNPFDAISLAKQTKQTLYATKYALASASKLALEFYDECTTIAIENPTYEFSADDLGELSALFGDKTDLFKEKFTDPNGFVVVSKADFDSFANTVYRNADDSARASFDQAYKKATGTLSASIVYDEESVSLAKSKISSLADSVKTSLDQAKTLLNSIPSLSADFDLDKLVEDYIPSQDDCKDLSTLKQAIENFGKKADDAFVGMNVSDEDAAAIKDMLAQSDIVKLIDDARATLDEALEQAKTDARNYLLSLKSARLA